MAEQAKDYGNSVKHRVPSAKELNGVNEPDIKRWSAKRKAALVKELIRGQTSISEAAKQYDLPPLEIEKWLEDAEAAIENAMRANRRDITEIYERKIQELQAAYGEAMLELKARKRSHRHLDPDDD